MVFPNERFRTNDELASYVKPYHELAGIADELSIHCDTWGGDPFADAARTIRVSAIRRWIRENTG